MGTTLGTGTLRFESVQDWAQLPPGWSFHEVAAVAVDSRDNVYVLSRGEHPIIVFDKDGHFVRSFGKGQIDTRAHGIHISPDEFVYAVSDAQHCIKKFTLDGKLLAVIGKEYDPAPKWGGRPFNRPTNMAVSSRTGEIYITDGYGNARVHRYSPDGRHLVSWGEPGCDPGQFQLPHNVVVDQEDNVYVTDRENNRVQVFDRDGRVQAIWHDVYRPDALCVDREGNFFVGELLNQVAGLDDCPGLGHRVSIYDRNGKRLARIGDAEMGDGPTQFIAPHGCAADSAGNVYIGEVSYTVYGQHLEPKRTFKSFRRLTRLR